MHHCGLPNCATLFHAIRNARIAVCVPVSITHLFWPLILVLKLWIFEVRSDIRPLHWCACRANLKRSSFYQNKPVSSSSRTFASSQVGARTNVHLYRTHSVTIWKEIACGRMSRAVSDSDNYSRRSKYLFIKRVKRGNCDYTDTSIITKFLWKHLLL